MAEETIKIEQIQGALKAFGLDENDFTEISSKDVTDFSPFVDKVKSNMKDVFLADTDFMDSITKPLKDLPIGKENQLKKEVRKAFNIQMTEDELKKTPFAEILKRGMETFNTGTVSEVEKYKNTATEYMEKYEALQNSIPEIEEKVASTYKTKLQQKDIREELINLASTETQVLKENLPAFVTAFLGVSREDGFEVTIDEKKNLTLKGADGLPVKKEDGSILRVKEAMKEFSTKLSVNVAPKGIPPASTGGDTTDDLMQIMGKGIR